jgi:hypothetical protein
MKNLLFLFSLFSMTTWASDPLLEKYCFNPPGFTGPIGNVKNQTTKEYVCLWGHKPIYFYEEWMKQDPSLTSNKIQAMSVDDLKKLKPDLTQDNYYRYQSTRIFITKYKNEHPEHKECGYADFDYQGKIKIKCDHAVIDLSDEYRIFASDGEIQESAFKYVFNTGKEQSTPEASSAEQKSLLAGGKPTIDGMNRLRAVLDDPENDLANYKSHCEALLGDPKLQGKKILKFEATGFNKSSSTTTSAGTTTTRIGGSVTCQFSFLDEKNQPGVIELYTGLTPPSNPTNQAATTKGVVTHIPKSISPTLTQGHQGTLLNLKTTQPSSIWTWGVGDSIPKITTPPQSTPLNLMNTNTELVRNEEIIPIGPVAPVAAAAPLEPAALNQDQCKEALNLALAEILKDDKKNIIGLQYELTVLKMASLASQSKGKTLESFIQSQAKNIQENDQDSKILNRVNEVYKKYGLPEDQTALVNHLKSSANEANYFQRDKRFYNEQSSAFILAYQKLNPASGFKDSDVSVLWYMNQVNQKAIEKSNGNKYSAQSNLTNLSTRVALYTAHIKGIDQETTESLNDLLSQQQEKLNKELKGVMDTFKSSNLACFNKLFAEDNEECNLTVMDEQLSQLLAMSSKINIVDQISLDAGPKGSMKLKVGNQELLTKFNLSRVVKDEIQTK